VSFSVPVIFYYIFPSPLPCVVYFVSILALLLMDVFFFADIRIRPRTHEGSV